MFQLNKSPILNAFLNVFVVYHGPIPLFVVPIFPDFYKTTSVYK